MNWNELLNVLRVRAAEEDDARDRAWDEATLRAVTQDAQESARNDDEKFLATRAEQLAEKSHDTALLRQLEVPATPGWLVPCCALAAFIAGWCFAALGQEREINLLALPLIAILLWNAAVLLLSLFHGAGKPAGGNIPRLMDKLSRRPGLDGARGEAETKSNSVVVRFRMLAWPVALQCLGFRFRAWLHIGAALLALGSVTGMYARGWSKEYRAVWESTLLNENGARTFFGALFAPASKFTGIAIPLEEIPKMRRGINGAAPQPGTALPWIHLYAATLIMFVIVPRALFALLELSRAKRVPSLLLRSPDWRDYLAGIRAAATGDGVSVCLVTHGLAEDDAALARWRRMVRMRWRDAGGAEFHAVAAGGEADFVSGWKSSAPRVMLLFNLSATPETEVHRALAEGLLTKLHQINPAAKLVLALDGSDLGKRWSGFADAQAKLAARTASWHEVMRGLGAEWLG